MSKNPAPEKVGIKGWPFRIQHPANRTADTRVMLLLHGHQGNENVMWILTKPLHDDYYLLSPRAPVNTGEDQYSWHAIAPQWPGIETYQALAGHLLSRVDTWCEQNDIEVNNFDLMGFSQGAVMAYALAFLHPERIGRVAALAGFIPQVWQAQLDVPSLAGKRFFIAHGSQDDIIPINKARQAADWLEKHGAEITFCEADIGHKLSASCFNGLGEFFY